MVGIDTHNYFKQRMLILDFFKNIEYIFTLLLFVFFGG